MAHLVIQDNSDGDVEYVQAYCSDYCAQSDPAYAGWYGCVELYEPELCNKCYVELDYVELDCVSDSSEVELTN